MTIPFHFHQKYLIVLYPNSTRLFLPPSCSRPAIPRLLDALTLFLHTNRGNERVALTLGLTTQHVLVTSTISPAVRTSVATPFDDDSSQMILGIFGSIWLRAAPHLRIHMLKSSWYYAWLKLTSLSWPIASINDVGSIDSTETSSH